MPTSDTNARLHVVLADLARKMHARSQQGPDAVLEEITARAVSVIDGVTAAGITLTKNRKYSTHSRRRTPSLSSSTSCSSGPAKDRASMPRGSTTP